MELSKVKKKRLKMIELERKWKYITYKNSQWVMMFLALTIGLVTGLSSVLFRNMITGAGDGYSWIAENIFFFLPNSGSKILIPIIAGIIVGPLTFYVAKEARGTGIPEVMEAVATKNGIIKIKVTITKIIATAASLGGGLSAGKEGPIIQIGSGLGSYLAQITKLNSIKIKTCVACGAAAGIAATFNTPLAGVMFAQEIIIGKFLPNSFFSIVISAVSASVVSQRFFGSNPAFEVQNYSFNQPIELLFYIMLGILAAIVGTIFVKILYKSEDIFNSFQRFPNWLKPALGGLIVAIIGIQFPEALGIGYDTIESIFNEELLLTSLLLLVIIKILASSITLSSGFSGGIFAPSLLIGAALGEAVGFIINIIFPELGINPVAYAIVGMGAVLAGTIQAPLTALLIIFEMTQDYRIVLPLMISVVFSTIIFSHFNNHKSIFTIKLMRRGVNLKAGKDVNLMRDILIEDVMTRKVQTCREYEKLSKVIQMMHDTKHNGFPVLNEKDELVGIITLQDIREAPVEGIMEVQVSKIMSKKLILIYPQDTLEDVYAKLSKNDLGHIPVVSYGDSKKLLGIITRSDLINAYNQKLFTQKSII